MRTLTILLLGLVVLPMTFLSPSAIYANGSGDEKSNLWKKESNFSDLFSLSVDDEALSSLMDFTITASSETVSQNQDFCVQFSVTNFTDILGMQFDLNYDPNQLQFSAVQNLNLVGLNQSAFGKPGEGAVTAGNIKVSWFDQNISGVSVADGTVIFEVCFTALTDNSTGTVGFSLPEIIDSGENIIPFQGEESTIIVGTGGDGGGNNGGNNGNANGFTVTISDESVQQGQEVCVQVSVDNFTDILGMQFDINYDDSKLQFGSIKNLNLAGLNQSSFNDTGNGKIIFSWFDQNVSGITVADGTVIFEVCFTALSDNATDNITMTNEEIIDSGENVIGFTGNNGTITIGDGGDGGGNNGGNNGNANGFTVTISDESVQVGQEVCVQVSVDNFTDILGMQFDINYDNSKLQFNSISNLNLDGLNQSSFNDTGNGKIIFSWFDQNVSGITVADGTVIFEVCFTALSNNTTAGITMTNEEIIDSGENVIGFTGNNGTITIGDGSSNNGGDFEIILANATVERNEKFCLGVSVNNFSDISGMEFTITYDQNLLTFDEVKGFNLTDLTESAFGLPGTGGNAIGTMKVSWFDMGGSGVSVADGTRIFEVCFDAGNTAGTTDVDFTGLEVIDQADNIITSNKTAGTVTINQGENTDLTFTVGNAMVDAGDTFCVPFEVDNFDNIASIQLTLDYDPAVLEFVEVKDFNLKDLNSSSFGVPGMGNVQDGNIILSWIDQATTGVTVADNTNIFSACFRAIGNGSTTITIEENGLEATNGDENLVPVFRQNGVISISGIPPTTDLQFVFGNETGMNGDQVCIPVLVNNFDNVLGMEFVMRYDPTVLNYASIQNLNLDQLNTSSFGVPGLGTTPEGEIKISWIDQTVAGVSVPDGTVIFEICFDIVGSDGSSTTIGIDTNLPVEVIDVDENLIVYQQVIGNVTVSSAPPLALASPAVITNVTCVGNSDGAIDIAIQGGSGSYSYAWSFNNATSEDLTGLPTGSYTVTVTDNTTNQTLNQTFQVGEPTAISIDNTATTDVSCTGEATGSIQLTVSGGTGDLSYAWDGGLAAEANPSNVAAGTYNVTITDQNGCTTNGSATINEPASALSVTPAVTDESCGGQNDGAITLSVSGGTGAYTYNWGNGLSGDVDNQSGVGAGTYPVTITDENNCSINTSIDVGSTVTISISEIQTTFIADGSGGSVSISTSGGAAPYSYSWTGPDNFTAGIEDLTNLSAIGQYCVTVTDANGCESDMCAMVLERLSFGNVNITNSCAGQSTGSITVQVNGGMAPYSYSWDQGGNTETISGLATGNYALTITDALGNTFNGQFPVSNLPVITVQSNVRPETGEAGVNNGSISLNVIGGNPGYTYNWSTGANTNAIQNLGAGEYCVTVTDQNGCEVQECYDVALQTIPLSFNVNGSTLDCFGDQDGTATVEVIGGVAPYVVTFADNTMESTNGEPVTKDNLPAGELLFVITDASNTTVNGSIMVTQPDPISINSTRVVHDVDAAGCTGQITIAISGGTPDYSVQWNSPNTGFQIIGLCEGNYIPTVVDGNGCQVSFDPIFVNTFSIAEEVNDVECRGDSNGSITVTPAGGSGEYAYRWEDADGMLVSETNSIENVPAGTYTVTVVETSGNTLVQTYEVGTKSNLTATASVDSDYRGFGVSCGDATDGMLSALATDGAGDYVYSWMLGDNIVGEGMSLNNAAPGNYVLEVVDANGCMTSEEVTLTAPSPIEVAGFVTNPTCVGDRNGSVTVVPSGGSGSYTYNWSNTDAAPTINGLVAGRYTVTITDANSCQTINDYDVEEPTAIQVSVETTPATDGCNGSARATVSGGTGPYEYRWNSNMSNTDSVLTGLCPGPYVVAVTDARGCTSTPDVAMAEVLDRRFPCMNIRTVISPDGDGLNETFLINCIEEMQSNRVMIYNRWGQLVFEAENYSNDWDGVTMDGERLPDGAYYFVLEFTDVDGNFVQTKGSITLLREE